jgi:divalent metal cation (Fe/Co/Zn/Cd) transporter
VVVLGLVFFLLGEGNHIPWLENADVIAALVVACVVVNVSWRLARQTIDALLDAAPAGVRAKILNRIERVDGVIEVDRVRIRSAGNKHFADVSFGMARTATFQRAEQVGEAVSAAIRSVLPEADVVIHSTPRATTGESIFDRVRAVASRHNLNVHDVNVQDLEGRRHVEMHLEMDESLSLRKAHDLVTTLEAEIQKEIPEIDSILTHIESEPGTIESGADLPPDPAIEEKLRGVAKEFSEIIDVHDVIIKQVRGLHYLSCHCTLSDDLPLSRVHDISTAFEIRLKQAEPRLFKVLIHTEPATDNKR